MNLSNFVHGVFGVLMFCCLMGQNVCAQNAEELGKAIYQLQNSDPDSGVTAARQMIADATRSNDLSALQWGYHALGENLKALSQYDSAIFYQQKALELARQIPDSVMIGRALNSTAVNFKAKAQFDSATTYYLQALKIREAIHDTLGVARVHNNLGSLLRKTNKLDTATKCLIKSVDHYNSIGANEVAYPMTNLGHIYFELDNFDEAVKNYKSAFSAYSLANNTGGKAKVHFSLARVYGETEQLDSAEQYYRSALALYTEVSSAFGIADSHTGLGSVYKDLGKTQLALNHYLIANETYTKGDDQQGLSMTLNNIGELFELEGSLEKALEYYLRSVQLFEEQKDIRNMKAAYYNTFRLYKKLREDREALFYFEKYTDAKDSLLSEEKVSRILELQAKYESAQKDITLKEQEAEIATSKTETLQWILILSGIAVLITIVALSLYMRQRAKNLKEKLKLGQRLREKESEVAGALIEGQDAERSRIGKDLHDNVGARLSTLKYQLDELEAEAAARKAAQLDTIVKLLDETVTEVRGLSHNLATGVLGKYGLTAAIKDLASANRSSKGPHIHVQAFGVPENIDNTTSLYIYRIVQELLNNILKHASATETIIRLEKKDDKLLVQVTDDGVGFDQTIKKDGIGLANISNRVLHLGGVYSISSSFGKGTQINIEIPISQTS